MTFSNKNKDSTIGQPKRQSLFGLLFKPQFGSPIAPMRQDARSFVKLVAGVFSVYKLIPKDYPGLNNPDAPISFFNVLSTAWSNLRFTRDGSPQVILFFAVTGLMLISVIAIISVLLSLFVGQAHAQGVGGGGGGAGGYFTNPNQGTDLAYNWIEFLFDTQNSSAAIQAIQKETGVTMPAITVQTALVAALAYYSDAILVIAAIILFYHLASMVVETAHHGQVMGKRASQIWAPIRLVVAVGLLVPVNGGLNCGQYIVIKVAEMGSALASNVWASFVTTLAANSTMPPIAMAEDAGTTVYSLSLMYACEYDYNYQVAAIQGQLDGDLSEEFVNGWGWTLPGPPRPAGGVLTTNPGKYSFQTQRSNGVDLCGSYTIPTQPVPSNPILKDAVSTIYNSVIKAFVAANTAAASEGAKIQAFMQIPAPDGPGSPITPTPTDLQTMSISYQTDLINAAKGAGTNALQQVLSQTATKSSQMGWIAAGAFFNQLSSGQAELTSVVGQSMPTTTVPTMGIGGGASTSPSTNWNWFFHNGANSTAATAYSKTIPQLGLFNGALTVGGTTLLNGQSGAQLQTPTSAASCNSPVGCVLNLVNIIAGRANIWQSSSSGNGGAGGGNSLNNQGIGVQFAGANPLLEMSNWGHKNIAASLALFNWGVLAYALSGATGAAASLMTGGMGVVGAAATDGFSLVLLGGAAFFALLSVAGTPIGVMLFFMGSVFFTLGSAVAYYVPFLPFMHFFFNTITWVSCVAECIVAVPLIALAHLNPEGEGLPGQAKSAYHMVFSVALRPIMMVFGLIVGLLIMFVAVGLLNALYAIAVAGNSMSGETGSPLVISRMMYSVIYVVILYSIANHAFGLISTFPNKAMEWMGARGLTGDKMGEPGHIGTGIAAASAYAGKEFGGMLKSGGSAMSHQMQQSGQTRGKIKYEQANKEAQSAGQEHGLAYGAEAGNSIPSQYAGDPKRDYRAKSFLSGMKTGQNDRQQLEHQGRLEGSLGGIQKELAKLSGSNSEGSSSGSGSSPVGGAPSQLSGANNAQGGQPSAGDTKGGGDTAGVEAAKNEAQSASFKSDQAFNAAAGARGAVEELKHQVSSNSGGNLGTPSPGSSILDIGKGS